MSFQIYTCVEIRKHVYTLVYRHTWKCMYIAVYEIQMNAYIESGEFL